MALSGSLRQQVVNFLVPFMANTERRQTLVEGALHGNPVLNHIQWSGGANDFTFALVRDLELYGGRPALVELLEHLRGQVGPGRQGEVDRLIENITRPPISIDEDEEPEEEEAQNLWWQRREILAVMGGAVLLVVVVGSVFLTRPVTPSESTPTSPFVDAVCPPPSGALVFATYRNPNDAGELQWDIYQMPADGSAEAQPLFADPKIDERYPSISPDGTRIAYLSNEFGDYDVQIKSLDGESPNTLINTPYDEVTAIAWSPDGQELAFSGWTPGVDGGRGYYQIYKANASGIGSVEQLTVSPGSKLDPAWSPDGQRIAYYNENPAEDDTEALPNGLWVMGTDGSNPTRVQSGSFEYSEITDPFWSADGQRLLFSGRVASSLEIIEMDIRPPYNARILTQDRDNDWDPAYSPDEQYVAFYSTRSKTIELLCFNEAGQPSPMGPIQNVPAAYFEIPDRQYNGRDYSPRWLPEPDTGGVVAPTPMMVANTPTEDCPADLSGVPGMILFGSNADRTGAGKTDFNIYSVPANASQPETLLYGTDADDRLAAFSPDGSQIAFISSYAEEGENNYWFELWLMDADGTNARRLTDMPEIVWNVMAWSPDSQQIAFRSGDGGNAELYTLDLTTPNSQPVQRTRYGTDYEVRDVAWSPDGRSLIYQLDQPVAGQNTEATDEADSETSEEASENSNGETTVHLWILDLETGESARLLADHPDYTGSYQPAWAPDGNRIIYSTSPSGYLYTAALLPPHAPQIILDTDGNRIRGWNPIYSPDGRFIAYHDFSTDTIEVMCLNAEGHAVRLGRVTQFEHNNDAKAEGETKTYDYWPSWVYPE